MLTSLSIRDIVLIDKLDLAFGEGLSVLTGETGAGKSILLDAFTLAIGGRGDAALVRKGASQGQVTAVFEPAPGHPVLALLDENEIAQEGTLILRRVQNSDGRTRAFLNDQTVSIQLLKQVGQMLVEIHGQHDDRALIDQSGHRDLVDAYAGLTGDSAELGRLWDVWKDAERALEEHAREIETIRANADFVSHALEELRALDPQEGEEESLADRRALMMSAEKIASELVEALDALQGEGTAQARIAAALRRIERQAEAASELLTPVADALEKVMLETENARNTIERSLAETAFEPQELEQAEERLFALRALARKHKVLVDDLPALTQRLETELENLEQGESRLEALNQDVEKARQAFETKAVTVSDARRDAAAKLDEAIIAELGPLKLEKARFITKIERLPLDQGGPSGIDRVAFHVQTNPGTEPGPMMKVASGGELARFILALKVVLASRGSAPTLVFDEIDTGVGGATAAAIGERLARLADQVQVLVVTHAPQVAAQAHGHLRIAKESVDGDQGEAVATRVVHLEGEHRREEIARMLAGQEITDEARAAAERLMSQRAGERTGERA
ncbi:DNA repair protein RecN [Methyloligella halotolerans]|uniref:DNA repair protein RecN n=1 Tax=Methyloligella halotolerans TaxID=1177755 RepID=A0A1E2S3B6_9HYPH|nr:DNA repair protein RecN [Methyloligella halotolerans]ODA69006.1 DNA repair protein RecN [Methyloligella halotolerans]